MTRAGRLFLLLLAVACLAGVLFLQGCAELGLRRVGYLEWFKPSGYAASDYYRWVREDNRASFELLCGAAGSRTVWACAAHYPAGVVKPGDKSPRTGEVYSGEARIGKLCVVYAHNMSEDDAKHHWALGDDNYGSLRDHEVIGHCRDGLVHRWVK